MIFKRGDTKDLNNYMPISVLNTIYKIFTIIITRRIEQTIDPFLQKTQFRFRKEKSTQQAIHLIRRIIDKEERAGQKAYLVLLDWEKAFDKVDQGKLFTALEGWVFTKNS